MKDAGVQFSRKEMGYGSELLPIMGTDDLSFFVRDEFYFMKLKRDRIVEIG